MIKMEKTFFDDDADVDVQGVRVSKMCGSEAEIVAYAKMKRILSSSNPVKFWQVISNGYLHCIILRLSTVCLGEQGQLPHLGQVREEVHVRTGNERSK